VIPGSQLRILGVTRKYSRSPDRGPGLQRTGVDDGRAHIAFPTEHPGHKSAERPESLNSYYYVIPRAGDVVVISELVRIPVFPQEGQYLLLWTRRPSVELLIAG
jgi:hypothetical protein